MDHTTLKDRVTDMARQSLLNPQIDLAAQIDAKMQNIAADYNPSELKIIYRDTRHTVHVEFPYGRPVKIAGMTLYWPMQIKIDVEMSMMKTTMDNVVKGFEQNNRLLRENQQRTIDANAQ